MPTVDDNPSALRGNRQTRRAGRNARRLAVTKLEWRGRGLRLLDAAEKLLTKDLDAAAGDYSARCSIVRTLCDILDTRRILVGDPLPGTLRPSKQTTYEAWKDAAVPALPMPVSISQAQASVVSHPTHDTSPSVQSAESSVITLDVKDLPKCV